MRVWLVRHAHAVDGADDSARELSSRGEQQVDVLAAFIRGGEIPGPAGIWHSSLVRARQTAERLAEGAAWETVLEPAENLQPYDDVTLIARRLEEQAADVAIVGHEPHLGRLGSWLITGDADADVFLVRKGCILCLEHGVHIGTRSGAFRRWSVAWMIHPALLPVQEA